LKTLDSWFVIINPISGNGIVKKKKQSILNALNNLNYSHKVNFTQHSKHEIDLVKEGIKQGFRKFISIGGDGTLHHVVNGVMIHGNVFLSEIKVGVIPVGTGNDWAKNYAIPNKISECIKILNYENTTEQDIGKLTHDNSTFYFNNLAGLGFDGLVVKNVLGFSKFGKLAYLLASLKSLISFKKPTIIYSWDNKTVTTKSYIVATGICTYCGGGMRLTQNPNPDDGLFDVTVVKDISKLEFIWNIRKMFNGKLHQHPQVETFKTNHLAVTAKGRIAPLIQVDGELIGEGDLEVETISKAVCFVVPKI
jgi:diacylglycerol kinase (ATP)